MPGSQKPCLGEVTRTMAMNYIGHMSESCYQCWDRVSQNGLEVAAQRLGSFTGGLFGEKQQ
jgi:hypothetical protein